LTHSGLQVASGATSYIRQTATVFSEEADQSGHALEIGAVKEVASLTPPDHKPSLHKALEMKRQRWRRDLEAPGKLGGGVTLGTTLDQQSVKGKPRLRRQGAECRDRLSCFHTFNYIELYTNCKLAGPGKVNAEFVGFLSRYSTLVHAQRGDFR
jgi:hypothetical protein